MGSHIDLHALANTPGAGKAIAELEERGLLGEDETAPLWVAILERTRTESALVAVRARSKKEARRLALVAARNDDDCWDREFAPVGRPKVLHAWEAE